MKSVKNGLGEIAVRKIPEIKRNLKIKSSS